MATVPAASQPNTVSQESQGVSQVVLTERIDVSFMATGPSNAPNVAALSTENSDSAAGQSTTTRPRRSRNVLPAMPPLGDTAVPVNESDLPPANIVAGRVRRTRSRFSYANRKLLAGRDFFWTQSIADCSQKMLR